MSGFVDVTVHLSLPAEAIDLLAARVAERVRQTEGESRAADDWLSTRQAARYLGLSVPALHRLTAARSVPFEQSGPGARCWFQRSALDGWRSAGEPSAASNLLPQTRKGL